MASSIYKLDDKSASRYADNKARRGLRTSERFGDEENKSHGPLARQVNKLREECLKVRVGQVADRREAKLVNFDGQFPVLGQPPEPYSIGKNKPDVRCLLETMKSAQGVKKSRALPSASNKLA